MRRMGVQKLLSAMKDSFGFGTLVGSGHKLNWYIRAPMMTIGMPIRRSQRIFLRAQAPGPALPLAITKPSTKTACQAKGLKNQWPGTGQLGTVRRKARTTA